MNDSINDAIHGALEDAERYPFLFIGSGLSRRYAATPDWEGLLSGVCADVFSNPLSYARFKSSAKSAVQNGKAESELPYVATLMENPVNEALYTDDKFADFRARHEKTLTGEISPFKMYIADKIIDAKVEESVETKKLSQVGREKIAGIITTNYDRLCETLFPSFTTFVGQNDLLFSEPTYSQEIYKIHGSADDPSSLVLTSADYLEFAHRRKYLAAKLLTLFVEYPVIFLGYSISDENIQSILSDICDCLSDDKLNRLSKRFIFVQYDSKTSIDRFAMSFGGKSLTMTKIATDDFESIYDSLLSSKLLYSPRLIRELRGSIFKLAEHLDPSSEIVVSGVDNVLNNLQPDQKIIVGISLSPTTIGKPISPEDIIEDIVLDDLRYDPQFIVQFYLNRFVRQFPNSMPVFKYTRDLNGNVGKNIAEYISKIHSIDNFRTNTIHKHFVSTRERFADALSVRGLEKKCPGKAVFSFIPYLEENEIDVDDLEQLLKRALEKTNGDRDARQTLLKDTYYRKCVRIYDFLRYRHA